jgi:hypothetical protein
MTNHTCPHAQLSNLAAHQHGVVSCKQLLDAGVTRSAWSRLVKEGQWIRVFPRVYRAAAAPPSFHQSCMAATLYGGPHSAISHGTGAVLLGIEGVSSQIVELTVPMALTREADGLRVHRSGNLSQRDKTIAHRVVVTSRVRTIIDLAEVLNPDALEVALDSVLRLGTSVAAIESRLKVLGDVHRPWSAPLRDFLAERRGGAVRTDSGFETLLRRVLIRAGITEPLTQYRLHDGERWIARFDLALPVLKVAFDPQGYEFHSSKKAWARDRIRQAEVASRGWLVLPVTWHELQETPELVLRRVRRVISHRAA